MSLLAIIVVAILVAAYFWYANIIARKNKALEALADIDVQFKKRHDLIPNILSLTEKYKDYEKDLFTQVTELRSQAVANNSSNQNPGAVDNQFAVESKLQAGMTKFFGVMENYPDLKSEQAFAQAQQSYNEVQEQIAAATRFYNAAVASLNNSIQIFPGNLLAKFANITALPAFYAANQEDRQAINANDYIK